MVIWCYLIVSFECLKGAPCTSETAVRGLVIGHTPSTYLVDFSEYASKKGYLGNWDEFKTVNADKCIKD
jgi:hypothetical protein